MKPIKRLLVLALLTPLAAGCFKESALETVPPPPSTRLVAELTDSGTLIMSNALGPGALEVEGVVAAANDTEWTLQMVRVDHRDGRSIDWNREIVRFPSSVLSNPTVRVVDKTRSWLAAGAITIGAMLAARAFNFIGGDDDTTQPPPPPASLVPPGGR